MTDNDRNDIGIDIGKAKIAYAWPAYTAAGSLDVSRQKLDRHLELRRMQDWLLTFVPRGARLWIDRPLFAGTGTSAGERLTETVGAILTAQEWVFPPTIVHSSTWKSQMIGNHRADKDEIRAWVETYHPELAEACHGVEDEYDAMTIGLYGRARSTGVILAPVRKPVKRRKVATT